MRAAQGVKYERPLPVQPPAYKPRSDACMRTHPCTFGHQSALLRRYYERGCPMELTLRRIFSHVMAHHIPGERTQAGRVLLALAGGYPVPTAKLIQILEVDPRSAIQCLRSESGGFWLIKNINKDKGRGLYQLSPLHLTGKPLDDAEARAIRRRELACDSKNLALREALRLPSALERYEEAMQTEFKFTDTRGGTA
jgi:hypothetical protein